MKRILGIAVVLGLVGALTVIAQEVKLGKVEVIELGKDVSLEMVFIPAGKFLMGSKSKSKPDDPFSNIKVKQPLGVQIWGQHEVTLTKSFYMGKYEVTQEQWFEVMGKNPSSMKGRKLPITDVTWYECQEFIKKLNVKTSGGYRLPTEAEWEYGCRAGTTTNYSYGDSITKNDANISNNSLKPVGSYKPNSFGLYDMHGNVMEWCEDWFGPYSSISVTDPIGGPAKGLTRVLRGGSFDYIGSFSCSFNRYDGSGDGSRSFKYGFRLARTP